MNKYILLLLLFLCVGCSTSSDTTEVVENSVDVVSEVENGHSNDLKKVNMVFSISQTGGCMMAGPNCAEFRLNVEDGHFDLLRVQENSAVEKKGKIDQALVNAWFSELNKMQITEFISGLGEGECRACYDGVDIDYNVVAANVSVLSLASRDKSFDQSKKFFALSQKIYQQMSEQARLEMKMRQ